MGTRSLDGWAIASAAFRGRPDDRHDVGDERTFWISSRVSRLCIFGVAISTNCDDARTTRNGEINARR